MVKNLAGEPRVQFEFSITPITATAELAGAKERLLCDGALMRSVQMAGALQRALGYSLQYANERVQFGRPIGKFQAVQHMLAVLAGHAAATAAAADAAIEVSRWVTHAQDEGRDAADLKASAAPQRAARR